VSVAEFDLKRNLLIRAKHNSELVKFITELAENRKITTATFTVIGAVKRAKLGFYDQEKHEYHEIVVDSPHEIASCIGNISLKNGKAFVHAHAVLADESGKTAAGHILKATIFAAEIHLRDFKGRQLEREYDEETGLYLWKINSK